MRHDRQNRHAAIYLAARPDSYAAVAFDTPASSQLYLFPQAPASITPDYVGFAEFGVSPAAAQPFFLPADTPAAAPTTDATHWGEVNWSLCVLYAVASYNPGTGHYDHGAQISDAIGVVGIDLLIPSQVALARALFPGAAESEAAATAFDKLFAKIWFGMDAQYTGISTAYASASADPGEGLTAGAINAISSLGGAGAALAFGLATAGMPLGLLGVGLGVLTGFTVSKVLQGTFNYFVYTNGGQGAIAAVADYLQPPGYLIQDIVDISKTIGAFVQDPATVILNTAVSTIENEFQKLMYDFHAEAESVLAGMENLANNYLIPLAKYFSVIGDVGDATYIGTVLIPEISSVANDLASYYVNATSITGSVMTALTQDATRELADYSVLQASGAEAADTTLPNDGLNEAALADLYETNVGLFASVESAAGSASQLLAAINLGAWQDGGFGGTGPTSPTGGTITGTTGADLLEGTSGADIFNGLGGGDTEIGDGGADVFIFDAGYGALEVIEFNPGGASTAIVMLGTGITEAEIKVTADAQGDIILTIGTSGDQITLSQELLGASYGVADILFTGGTEVSRAQLAGMALTPTTGADVLYGTATAQSYNGLGGGDTVIGLGGGDTFIFDRGYGTLEINETDASASPHNVLSFGAGIATTDVQVTADSAGDLILTVLSNGSTDGDAVTLDGELEGSQYGVQSVVFSSGTTWTHAQLLAFAAVPTTGADNLYLSAAGTIDGLGGGDTIHGSGGADTFVFKQGYGALEISEQSANDAASTAKLSLGTGLSFSTMTVTSDGQGNLFLGFSATDIVRIDGALFGANNGIGKAVSSTGTTLTGAQLIALEENGAAGSLTLYGTSGTNTFTNLGHGDVVNAGGTNDTFDYATGAGALTINESNGGATRVAALHLSGIASTAATFAIASGTENIVLTDGVTGDSITLTGMANATDDGVTGIVFSDKTLNAGQIVALASGSLSLTGIGTKANPLTGGAGYNTITATAADAYIVSPGIYDTISAKFGGSTIILEADAAGVPHDASIVLGKGSNTVTAVDGNVAVSGLDGKDSVTLGNGANTVSGGGSGNLVSVLSGASRITLGSATAASSGNTVSDLSGGTVSLTGNTNKLVLGSASVTNSAVDGGTTVTLAGAGNVVTAYATNGEILGDGAASSATTFSLTDGLGSTVNVLGTGDMVAVFGGLVTVADLGSGMDLSLTEDKAGIAPNIVLSGFSTDAKSMLTLATDLGYKSLSGVLKALTSDGGTGSFLTFGGTTGAGIDFTGVSVGSLTAFLNSGTHITFG